MSSMIRYKKILTCTYSSPSYIFILKKRDKYLFSMLLEVSYCFQLCLHNSFLAHPFNVPKPSQSFKSSFIGSTQIFLISIYVLLHPSVFCHISFEAFLLWWTPFFLYHLRLMASNLIYTSLHSDIHFIYKCSQHYCQTFLTQCICNIL